MRRAPLSKPPVGDSVSLDPGLQQIDEYERRIIAAHDEKATLYGIDPVDIAEQRPAVVALARAIRDAMRADYRARQTP